MTNIIKQIVIFCLIFLGQPIAYSLSSESVNIKTFVTSDKKYVNVQDFGAKADAKKIGDYWIGTDNSVAFNNCAAFCRANGLTMYIPKGNYGVATTIWLTNPDIDGKKQAAISVEGSNDGAYLGQTYSANICVLKGFQKGTVKEVKKTYGKVKEPVFNPVIGISNGRQVHIQGIGIQGNNTSDLICAVAIGKVSQLISFKNCSFHNTFAGIVWPGLREEPDESVVEGNNDLLLVEQCTFWNAFNLVCGGTQPFSCEFRNSRFKCIYSVFTGRLITNKWGHSRGSHRFYSNLFGTGENAIGHETTYFDLAFNEITIDSCHFETGVKRKIPEVLIRQYPEGGRSKGTSKLSFINNIVNFTNLNASPSKNRPILDIFYGNKVIIQGNHFRINMAPRIKASNAILIGNNFSLGADHNIKVIHDEHELAVEAGEVLPGKYDINHFIRKDSNLIIQTPEGEDLKKGRDFKLHYNQNAFEVTKKGKEFLDKLKVKKLLLSYRANDAAGIQFYSWGANVFNPPYGWHSQGLILIGNKVVKKSSNGQAFETELMPQNIIKRNNWNVNADNAAGLLQKLILPKDANQ